MSYTYDIDTLTVTITGTGTLNSSPSHLVIPITGGGSVNAKTIIINGYSSIGVNAFYGASSLSHIIIPAGVTSIGANAFTNTSLSQFTVDANNNYYLSDSYGVLFNKSQTHLRYYPIGNTRTSYIIPNSVMIVGQAAFYKSTFSQITIPNSVTMIDTNAFAYAASLTQVTLPVGLLSMGTYAVFHTADLRQITIPNTVISIGGAAFQNSGLIQVTIPNSVISIGQGAFSYMSNLIQITLPVGLKKIENTTFIYSRELGQITIPNSVTSIGSNVFRGVTGLISTITLPTELKFIGENAFSDATNLTKITIPAGVTSIELDAFSNTGLNTVYYPSTTNTLGLTFNTPVPFYGANGVTILNTTDPYAPAPAPEPEPGSAPAPAPEPAPQLIVYNDVATNLTYTYFTGTTTVKATIISSVPANVTIPSTINISGQSYTVNRIAERAFINANTLMQITIPASITTIGSAAFFNTPSVSFITVDANNNYYSSDSYGVLFNKTKTELIQYPIGNTLTSYVVPNSVTYIRENSFQGATKLTEVTLPTGLLYIAEAAFFGLTNLSSITLPSSLISIEKAAFRHTYGLSSINIPAGIKSIKTESFQNTHSLKSVTFSEGSQLTEIGYTAFSSSSITSIIIPAGVNNIVDRAFYENGKMTQFMVDPANNYYSTDDYGVLYNKSKSFIVAYPCGNDRMAYEIPNTVTTIGYSSFHGAQYIRSLTFAPVSQVKLIDQDGLNSLVNLTSINIPASVVELGLSALSNAFKLRTVTFEEGSQLTNIMSAAFWNAYLLTTITIPVGVTRIGIDTFHQCGLTSISLPDSLQYLENGAFRKVATLTQITIPIGIVSIGETAFIRSGLTKVFFNSALTISRLGMSSQVATTGYVGSFFGKNSVDIRLSPQAKTASAQQYTTSVISNPSFVNLSTALNIDTANTTITVDTAVNTPTISYNITIRIPNTSLSTLNVDQQTTLIDTTKLLYASSMSISPDKLVITLIEGSIIILVSVLADLTDNSVGAPPTPICFPKGTLVTTNQGNIAIEELNPDVHTIRNKRIVAITQSRPLFKHIVSIECGALGKNLPNHNTQISNEHKVYYKGRMVKAIELVGLCDGVKQIPYNGEILYNVLMEKHDNMMINNLICETLHPENIMAKICGGKYNSS